MNSAPQTGEPSLIGSIKVSSPLELHRLTRPLLKREERSGGGSKGAEASRKEL